MATFNSTQYGNTQVRPRVDNGPTDTEGRVRVMYAELPSDHGNTLAQNDVINLFTLPKGSVPLNVTVTNGAFGASVVLDIGWDGNPDAIVDGHGIAAAGSSVVSVEDLAQLAQTFVITATLAGGNPADNVGLKVALAYVAA